MEQLKSQNKCVLFKGGDITYRDFCWLLEALSKIDLLKYRIFCIL